jgi:hypothetical protein
LSKNTEKHRETPDTGQNFTTAKIGNKGGFEMHSHDRTMLARLGFADPDKGDKRHDLACSYLSTAAVARRLIEAMLRTAWAKRSGTQNNRGFRGEATCTLSRISQSKVEVALNKGSGQYKATVGFLDVVIPFEYLDTMKGEQCETKTDYSTTDKFGRYPDKDVWKPCDYQSKRSAVLAVEVKASSSIGSHDIIRQINLYREYFNASGQAYCESKDVIWAAATLFQLSQTDVATLRSEGIHAVQLGQNFEEWMVQREREEQRIAESGEPTSIVL